MNKCDEHKASETNQWKSESAIVVLKQGNACGAKGWQIDRAEKRNNDCTQQRQGFMVNETGPHR